jgi:hypothetical protein
MPVNPTMAGQPNSRARIAPWDVTPHVTQQADHSDGTPASDRLATGLGSPGILSLGQNGQG